MQSRRADTFFSTYHDRLPPYPPLFLEPPAPAPPTPPTDAVLDAPLEHLLIEVEDNPPIGAEAPVEDVVDDVNSPLQRSLYGNPLIHHAQAGDE